MSARTRRGAAALVLAAVVGAGAAPARAETATFAGACALTVTLTQSPPADLSLGATSMSLSATGTCVINETVVWGALTGSLGAPLGTWSCAGGVATGTGVFDTGRPDFTGQLVTLMATAQPGSLSLVAYRLPAEFDGVGEFVQVPAEAQACASGAALTTMTYTGAFALQDPKVDPPV